MGAINIVFERSKIKIKKNFDQFQLIQSEKKSNQIDRSIDVSIVLFSLTDFQSRRYQSPYDDNDDDHG